MMHISDTFKDMIVEEVDFVIQQMQQSANELEKLYYFSGVYALFQRIFNIEYNTNLVYVHFILRSTHETFIQRIKAIQSGDTTVPLCKEQSEKLLELTQELRDKIKDNEDIDETLKRFVVLSFSASGNGYYLWQKKRFKI